jgi:hypothetical protein
LFCENETNNERLYHVPNETTFVRDGINNHIINGDTTVNPGKFGTKSAIWHHFEQAGEEKALEFINNTTIENPGIILMK